MSITGVCNLREGRKDPNGRGKRILYRILMLGADAGFDATRALAPHEKEGRRSLQSSEGPSTHRAVALTSMGVATISYLYYLCTNPYHLGKKSNSSTLRAQRLQGEVMQKRKVLCGLCALYVEAFRLRIFRTVLFAR
jgi:hypothetical protein